MAPKLLLAALLCCGIALYLAHARPHQAGTSNHHNHERQYFDANLQDTLTTTAQGGPVSVTQPTNANLALANLSPANPEHVNNDAHGLESNTHRADTADLGAYDLDIPYLASSFSNQHIDELLNAGTASLDMPNGSRAELNLVGHRHSYGIDHIRASLDGNAVTVTRRGTDFFATIAHSGGSYRLEGNDQQTRAYPHQQIAARTIRHQDDYRYVKSR